MLKIENTEILGWEHAIRGMRNPMNSWEKSDSFGIIVHVKNAMVTPLASTIFMSAPMTST